jgi:hypothetical protein
MNVRAWERFATRLPNDPLSASSLPGSGTATVPYQVPGDMITFRDIVLNAAAGQTLQLPIATGSGRVINFIIGTAISSNNYVIKTAQAADLFQGNLFIGVNGSTNGEPFKGNGTKNITLNGTTTGGLNIGDTFSCTDYAANVWSVTGTLIGSGSVATPFS